MRHIVAISRVGSGPDPNKVNACVAPSGVPGPLSTAPVERAEDSASLSQTAAVVSRIRAAIGAEGKIRPNVVAQIKHDLSHRSDDRTAEIERAILRLLQEL